ncbi:MAG: thioredoxin, partial [Acidimicrobiaceae bacterium]|nr:thioredoxin [Acidimicrobiaceae bacterium]
MIPVRLDRRVDDPWEAIEACYDAGWTDGLPVVPPTEPLVDAMLAGGVWSAGDVLLQDPWRDLAVTARKAAVNAVMAGCLPEYFPVVGAALQAMSEPAFGLHAVAASTGGAAVLVAVNGPVRDEIGIHCKENLFGPGFRANATIGRTVRLVLRNCLMAIPGTLDKSTQGWAGKYAMCFGED